MLAALAGEKTDRIPRNEHFWSETVPIWQEQGIPQGVGFEDHFDLDMQNICWPDYTFRFTEEIIEDTDQYLVKRDGNGVIRKDFKGESGHTPHWLEHKLSCGKDWWEYKDLLVPSADRLPPWTIDAIAHAKSKGRLAAYSGPEAYESAWPVFGQVNLFTMMLEEPDVVKDIFDTYADLIIGTAQAGLDIGLDFDGAFLYGDVGYRNGLLFSPECYDTLLFPAHKKIAGYFNDIGIPIMLHSCGRIESLIPRFIEAGFAAIQPLEAKVGQDVRELKELYGDKIALYGNIDVRALSGTPEDVENEVRSKLDVATKGGKYIFHSDHSIPPTVPLANYELALRISEEY